MEVHGIGLVGRSFLFVPEGHLTTFQVKKLFDVACTLIDVMSCVPLEPHGFEIGPRDHLNHFIHLMSKLRGGQSRYLPLLLTKINETMPGLQSTAVPRALPSSFDGQFEETERDLEDANSIVIESQSMDASQSRDAYRTVTLKTEFSDLVGSPSYSPTHGHSPFGDTSGIESPFSTQESSYPG